MSPFLFNLYIADIDNRFKERNVGGINLGKERIWSLSYADNIVLVAKNREAMLDMISTLKGFLKNIKMTLNVEKTKMLVFKRKRNEGKDGNGVRII